MNWFSQRQMYLSARSSKLVGPATAVQDSLGNLSAAKKSFKEKDFVTAFRLFKSLAEQGNPEAQANLALMYEFGQGVDKNPLAAFKWHRAAAEKGVTWAQTNLGLAYANGRGTKIDDKEATKWLRTAALQGSTKAQEVLGGMYNQGRGIPSGSSDAAAWMNPSNSMYVAKLEKDYGKRIRFGSVKAERIVRGYNIDCAAPQKNGHHLPLINLLLARLSSMDDKDSWLETSVQELDGEVRITDTLRTRKGIGSTRVVFQIDKWGDLYPMGGIRTEAVRNVCFDSYGPIWLLGGS